MNRTLVNIIIDLVATLLFLGMIATGYLLRFPLPPGSNKTITLWGLSRHQWGDIHFWISLGLLVVLVIHLALHWNWIVTVIGKRCHQVKASQPSLVRSATWTISVFTVLSIAFGWMAQRDAKEIPQIACPSGAGHSQNSIETPDSGISSQSPSQSKALTWDDIYPILETNCLGCHGPQKQFAGFRVDQVADFFKSSGNSSLVVPGQGRQSLLIEIISGARTNMAMLERHKLAEADISRIKTWIDQGAK